LSIIDEIEKDANCLGLTIFNNRKEIDRLREIAEGDEIELNRIMNVIYLFGAKNQFK